MKSHIESIDFVRGIAIILVFSYHCHIVIFPGTEGLIYNDFFLDFTKNSLRSILLNLSPAALGWTGVQLFLVISGFLIHLGTIKKNLAFDGIKFYNKRFWRIYPPYLIVLLMFSIFHYGSLGNVLSHVLLIHNLSDKYFYGISGSFWSLALEVQLYLVYPAYLYLYKKVGANRALLVVAAIAAVSLAYQKVNNINTFSFETSVFKFWIIWVAGAHLAHAFSQRKRLFKINGIQLFLITLLLPLVRFTTLYGSIMPYISTLYYVILMEWLLYRHHTTDTKVITLVANIGLISYSIYLIHQPIINPIIRYFAFVDNSPRIIAVSLGCFGLISLISIFTYKYMELYSIQLGEDFYKKILKRKLLKNAQE